MFSRIGDGEDPLWNPLLYLGLPQLADPHVSLYYPPNWLFTVCSSEGAMNLLILSGYMIGSWGTYFFSRSVGASPTGSAVAAIVYTYGGYMLGWFGSSTSMVQPAGWAPWIWLVLEREAAL